MSILDDLLLTGINSGFKALNEAKRSVLKDVEQAAKRQRIKVEKVIKSVSTEEPIEAEFIDEDKNGR